MQSKLGSVTQLIKQIDLNMVDHVHDSDSKIQMTVVKNFNNIIF